MPGSTMRFYRYQHKNDQMASFTVKVKETDLWIGVDAQSYRKDIPVLVENHILKQREILEGYIKTNAFFKESIQPIVVDQRAPDMALQMIKAGNQAGVGPMAAVAGAFAESVGRFLLTASVGVKELIVENGGDLFLKTDNTCTVGIYAGNSPLSGLLGLQVDPNNTPLGICTSSGTVGPSLSLGRADAVVVSAPSAILADAVATALGNMVKKEADIETTLDYSTTIKGISGVIIIIGESMGIRGDINLCQIN